MAWAPDYVTLDEMRDLARIDDLEDDAVMALAIATASRAIDDHTNRQFGLVAGPEARSYMARPDYVGGWWVVDIDDLQTTTGLAVEVDGATVSEHRLEPVNAAAEGRPWTRLAFTDDSEAYPSCHPHRVDVTARWGWTAVPDTVKQATLLQASRLTKRRDAPFGVAGSPEIGSELRLLAKVDPDVAVSLRGYLRPRAVG